MIFFQIFSIGLSWKLKIRKQTLLEVDFFTRRCGRDVPDTQVEKLPVVKLRRFSKKMSLFGEDLH